MKNNLAISLLTLENMQKIDDFLKILYHKNINYIEIPLTKILDNYHFDKNKLDNFLNKIKKYSIQVSSIQSIFYKKENLNIFNESNHNEILDHLLNVFEISNYIGAKNIIFGSPINRKLNNLVKKDAENIAINLFKKISLLCIEKNLFFCIEPNAKIYGCDYINNINQAIEFVQKVNSPNILINADTGNMSLENDDLSKVSKFTKLIANFQISEKNLTSLQNGFIDHEKILNNFKIDKQKISLETLNLEFNKIEENINLFKKIIKNHPDYNNEN